jgi:sterol desaturase/sphingolipid hydroxylase (fatty acid hydroxylase superfamily)
VLWRFHQVHHSDAAFTVSTGVRFHPGELLLSLPLRLAAVALFGVPPEDTMSGVVESRAAAVYPWSTFHWQMKGDQRWRQ